MAEARADYESAQDQCYRKHHYQKKAFAKHDAKTLQTAGGPARSVYRCQWCGRGWLVGTNWETGK